MGGKNYPAFVPGKRTKIMRRLFLVLIAVVSVSTVYAQNSRAESLHILFPANSANLRGVNPELALQNQKVLTEIDQILLENPQYSILIDGHANPVLKTAREETATLSPLSLQRATAVANALVELYRIDRRRMILAGAGGRHASRSNAAQNRRVNFLIIADRANLAIAENLITDKGNLAIAEKWESLTEDVQNLIPPDILEAIEDLGIEINEGRNPPNIEGTYLVDTLELVRTTTGTGIANMWNKYVTFSRQDNTALTINADYTMQTENSAGPMSSKGPGSFIVGEGTKFTVVVDGTREQGGYTAKTVEIFSGEISEAGIKNYHWAVMMIDNSGDPLGIWILNSTGYAKRDSDGFSEKVSKEATAGLGDN
jgi:hypothetical protein